MVCSPVYRHLHRLLQPIMNLGFVLRAHLLCFASATQARNEQSPNDNKLDIGLHDLLCEIWPNSTRLIDPGQRKKLCQHNLHGIQLEQS
ncbi:hypothetical protein R3P38DRAFT_127147 [Favolaschia claudopus]|uniref:Secreted protein n=1 Tax=Favolaschia claudopus TaxID=2862362 RepID=A0AAV9ZX81_9AGAR